VAAHGAWGAASACAVCSHHAELDQCTQRGELADASSELERRQGFHLAHPNGSSYELQHLNLEEVAGKRGLTGEAVKAVATDDVEGGNCGEVREGAPSSAPELHTNATNIRQCLASDGKHGEESSLVVAEVARVICGGWRRSGQMMPIPRAKEALGCEDQLCKRNHPMVEPNGGEPVVSGRRSLTSVKGKNGKVGGSFPRPVVFIGIEEREVWCGP
jgi:hypothetical protein